MQAKITFLFTVVLLLGSACGEVEFPVPQASEVDADFTVTFSPDDFAPTTATFTSTTLVGQGVTEVSYLWDFGDGSTGSGEMTTHTYTESGNYNVRLVVQSPNDLDTEERVLTIRDPGALEVDIFFIDAGSLTINDLDGNSFAVPGFGTGLEYDVTNEVLYYTDDDNGTLNSVNRDGTGDQVLVSGLTGPRDIALDADNQLIYLASRGTNEVLRIDLTDNSSTVLYDNAGSGLGELPVGIDLYDGFLYVTCVEIDAESVWKGNVDGSGITRIIGFAAGGFGYGVTVDRQNEKIYFDNSDAGTIMQANLDGTDIVTITTTDNRVYGIQVDNTNEKLYWTERNTGNVYLSDLDGSNQLTVGTGFGDPRGLIFIE